MNQILSLVLCKIVAPVLVTSGKIANLSNTYYPPPSSYPHPQTPPPFPQLPTPSRSQSPPLSTSQRKPPLSSSLGSQYEREPPEPPQPQSTSTTGIPKSTTERLLPYKSRPPSSRYKLPPGTSERSQAPPDRPLSQPPPSQVLYNSQLPPEPPSASLPTRKNKRAKSAPKIGAKHRLDDQKIQKNYNHARKLGNAQVGAQLNDTSSTPCYSASNKDCYVPVPPAPICDKNHFCPPFVNPPQDESPYPLPPGEITHDPPGTPVLNYPPVITPLGPTMLTPPDPPKWGSPPGQNEPSPPGENEPSPPGENEPSPPGENEPSPPGENEPSPPGENEPSPPGGVITPPGPPPKYDPRKCMAYKTPPGGPKFAYICATPSGASKKKHAFSVYRTILSLFVFLLLMKSHMN